MLVSNLKVLKEHWKELRSVPAELVKENEEPVRQHEERNVGFDRIVEIC